MTTFYNPDLLDEPAGQVVKTAKDRHATALLYPPQGYDLTKPPEAFTVNANEISVVQIDLGVSASRCCSRTPCGRSRT